jgi:hypothetical protein
MYVYIDPQECHSLHAIQTLPHAVSAEEELTIALIVTATPLHGRGGEKIGSRRPQVRQKNNGDEVAMVDQARGEPSRNIASRQARHCHLRS